MVRLSKSRFRYDFHSQLCYLCCPLFGQVESVAHRGASLSAPEAATLALMVKAIELGVDRIGMDVRQSKRWGLALMHDARLERTTNGKGYLRVTLLMKNF